MILTYLRSSSYSCHSWCPMNYYITYVLGHQAPGILAAHRGTIFHKILEILGHIKLSIQNGEEVYRDEICGEISVYNYDLGEIEDQVYKYYSSQLVDLKNRPWTPKDLKDIKKWVKHCLEYNDGQLNPMNQNIFALEKRFDIPVEEEWAKYSYEINGQKLEGQLCLSGTIDNIMKVNDSTLEILDYKSGQSRKDWSKNVKEEQGYDEFQNNFQLKLYHYVISLLYPEYPNIITSIFYVRAGGLYTMFFNKDDMISTKEMIKKKFLAIKLDDNPVTVPSWKCKAFCPHGLLDYSGTDIKPLTEFREGRHNPVGSPMSRCDQISFALEKRGIDLVTQHYGKDGAFGKYKAPGAIE